MIVDVEGERIAADPLAGTGGDYDELHRGPGRDRARATRCGPGPSSARSTSGRRRTGPSSSSSSTPVPIGTAVRTRVSGGLLVGDVLRHAAQVTPHAVAGDPRRRRASPSPSSTRRRIAPRTRCESSASGTATGSCGGARRASPCRRAVRRPRQDRRGVRAGQRPAQRGRGAQHPRLRPARARRDRRRTGRAARRLGLPVAIAPRTWSAATRARRRRRARARRARPARHLLHQREHRRAEGRRALASGQLPAQLPEPRRGARRRDRLHVPALPHGGLVARARRLAGPPADPPRALARTPRRCCRVAERRQRDAHLRHPRGVGARSSSTASTATTSRALREADTGTSATPPELVDSDPRRAPPHRDARLLRLDRGRSGDDPRDGGPAAQARQRRPPPTRRRAAHHRRR